MIYQFNCEHLLNPKLSIIIPVLNEADTLPLILQDLKVCKESLEFPIECIVVDGGSDDRSVEICKQFNVQVLKGRRGRGQQMSKGAEVSRGEVMLFLHSDSRISSEHCLLAVKTVENNYVAAGGFTLKFDDSHSILKFAEWVNKVRFRLTRNFYGDHGIFVSRLNYERAGGMPQQALFEDVEFSRRLKRLGRLVMVPMQIVTSSRRFRAGGLIRTYLKMAVLHVLYRFKIPPEKLAKIYKTK